MLTETQTEAGVDPTPDDEVDLSVLIPVYNEVDNVGPSTANSTGSCADRPAV